MSKIAFCFLCKKVHKPQEVKVYHLENVKGSFVVCNECAERVIGNAISERWFYDKIDAQAEK